LFTLRSSQDSSGLLGPHRWIHNLGCGWKQIATRCTNYWRSCPHCRLDERRKGESDSFNFLWYRFFFYPTPFWSNKSGLHFSKAL